MSTIFTINFKRVFHALLILYIGSNVTNFMILQIVSAIIKGMIFVVQAPSEQCPVYHIAMLDFTFAGDAT